MSRSRRGVGERLAGLLDAPSLVAARSAIERRGGALQCTADGAHCARLSVLLPSADFGASMVPGPTAAGVAVRRVLVLDDEPGVRKAIERVLRRHGCAVTIAAGGEEAREAFEAQAFDVLLTDAVMPGTDTAAMIDAFSRAHSSAPIIVCSGYVPQGELARGIEGGRYRFLAKPFQPSELAEMVDHSLGRGEAP